MSGVHAETLLAAGYAVFLLLAAVGIERLARHSNTRATLYRTAGFDYHVHLDAWRCPEGEHLHRRETDHVQRVVRYRARPHVCNACARKAACTDSDEGREIAHPLDPWPRSEAGRFHRGVCMVPLALAAVIPVLALIRHHEPGDVLVACGVLGAALLLGSRMLAAFRAAPALFPTPGP